MSETMPERMHEDQDSQDNQNGNGSCHSSALNTDELRQKAMEMSEKFSKRIDNAMGSTAESLDKTANKMHELAGLLKQKNVDSLKEDVTEIAKKHPVKTLIGAMFLGIILGKLVSR